MVSKRKENNSCRNNKICRHIDEMFAKSPFQIPGTRKKEMYDIFLLRQQAKKIQRN